MPESTGGLRAFLARPWVYDLAQVLMGTRRAGRLLQERYIRARPGDRVLDLGCGTASILMYLPDVSYTGYDVSQDYVEAARQRWPGRSFHCGALPDGSEHYDLVLVLGVLHHLSDDEVRALYASARERLLPGGRIVSVDPCRKPWQNPLARLFFALDRGRNIRNARDYRALTGSPTKGVRVSDLMPWWVPYTHLVMEVRR